MFPSTHKTSIPIDHYRLQGRRTCQRLASMAGILSCGILAMALFLLLGPSLFAQEPEAEDPDAPQVEQRSAVIMAASSDGGQLEIQTFEMPHGDGPISAARFVLPSGAMMADGGIQSNSIGWLQDDNILSELDVVDEQRQQLQQLCDEIQQRRSDFAATVRDLPADKRVQYIRDFSSLLTANVDDQVEQILLPHQLERVKQIQLQTKMRRAGVRSLDQKELAEALGITDEQREKLKKKQAEVEKQLRKKIDQLRKEALDEVLSVLTAKQREKLKDMVGTEYDFKQRDATSPMMKIQQAAEKKTQ
jgi:hypothetical protein